MTSDSLYPCQPESLAETCVTISAILDVASTLSFWIPAGDDNEIGPAASLPGTDAVLEAGKTDCSNLLVT